MGVRRNLSEVAERIGGGTADFYDKLADNIKNFACQLYNDFPDQITQNKSLPASFARGFMDSTCGGSGGSGGPVPPAPTVPWEGGLCPVAYTIFVEWEFIPQGGTEPVFNRDFCFQNIVGPIESLTYSVDNVNKQLGVTVIAPQTPTGSSVGFNAPTGSTILEDSVVFDVIRQDGQPDDCGSPPLQYPPTSPDINNDYQTTIVINNNDGTDLTIPLVYAPIDFNFPMNFDLGGVDVVIDLGGIDFNFGPGGVGDGGGQLPDGQQDPLPIPKDNPGGGNTTRKFPPPNTEDFDEIIKQPSTEDTEIEGELLDYVTLQLTTIPANANTQIWVDGATVYYCGWFAFTSDTFVFKREPIHFEFTIWNAPKGATGYQYQLYPGFEATATVYKRKINQDGS